MTYLEFHLLFILPPILLLAVVQRRPLAGVRSRRSLFAIPLTALLALVYTTPWDNYIVWRGVWNYGPDRVLGTIGYVPVEEYLFFILQPFLTGLFLYWLLGRGASEGPVRPSFFHSVVVFYLAITAVGVLLVAWTDPRGTYMGFLLAWAGPVLAGTWVFGGRHITRYSETYLTAVAVPTLYLWIADRLALELGIWSISDRYSLGIDPLGLPVEEAVFFLLTNALVVQGVFLFLHGDRLHAAAQTAGGESIARPR